MHHDGYQCSSRHIVVVGVALDNIADVDANARRNGAQVISCVRGYFQMHVKSTSCEACLSA